MESESTTTLACLSNITQRPGLSAESSSATIGTNTRPGGATGTTNGKALFPLPGGWISRDCLALCMIWAKERSLLCPRNGEVAVVRCAVLV